MEQDKLYIIFGKRGQKMPEIAASYTDYETAIIEYYKILKEEYEDNSSWRNQPPFEKSRNDGYFFWKLMALPINCSFMDEDNSTDVQFGAGNKHMIKFKNYGEVIDEYRKCSRNKKIESVIE